MAGNELKVQNSFKVEVAKFIQKNGLQISEFVTNTTDNFYTLTHKDSNLYYQFRMNPESYDLFDSTYSTFTPNRRVEQNTQLWYNRHDILLHFDKWIRTDILKYIEQVNFTDPWDSVDSMFSDYSIPENDIEFTVTEIEELKTTLLLLPTQMKEQFVELKEVITLEQEKRFQSFAKDIVSAIENGATKNDVAKAISIAILELIIVSTLSSEPVKSIGTKIFQFGIQLFSNVGLFKPITPLIGF